MKSNPRTRPAAERKASRPPLVLALLALGWGVSLFGMWWYPRQPAAEAARRFPVISEKLDALDLEVQRLESAAAELGKSVKAWAPDTSGAWAQLHAGLTFDDVRALLGGDYSVRYHGVERTWTIKQAGEGRPGEVTFDVKGRVTSWQPPEGN